MSVAAGASANVLQVLREGEWTLDLGVLTGPCTVQVQLTFQRYQKTLEFHLAAGDATGSFGGAKLRLRGAARVTVSAPAGGPGTRVFGRVLCEQADAHVEPVAPVSEDSGNLVQGGGGAAGVWTTLGTGYPHADRTLVTLHANGGLDYRLIDVGGNQRGYGTFSTATAFVHPPHYRLQVRHPGGGADTRRCLATWSGA